IPRIIEVHWFCPALESSGSVPNSRTRDTYYTLIVGIGRFLLFANPVRFERPKKLVFPTYRAMPVAPSNSTGFRQPKAQDHAESYVNVVNGSSTAAVPSPYISSGSALVLDDSCVVERDLSKYAMGKVKDVNSISNLRTLLMDEGFFDVKLEYLEVHDFVSDERIVLVDIKRIPLNVWSRETFMRIGKKWGETLDIEDNELFTWNPTFFAHKEMVYTLEDESIHSPKNTAHSPFSEEVSGDDSESDVEEVSETIFDDNSYSPNNNSDEMEINRELVDPNVVKEGGSVFGVLEDILQVGQAMGYTMDGCVKDFERFIGTQGDDDVSRWIFYLLIFKEANVFKKDYATIPDNFVSIYGTWLPINSKILFAAIYAPQEASCKRVLWEYVSILIGRWNGETVILGDFNEVRSIDESRGSCFNPSSARVFDHFISSSGLVDVKLEGYAFTWSHPSGSKMNHLPILFREVYSDFGPIPFRFYHSWFRFEGFNAMVEQTWRSFSHFDVNRMIRFKKKLQDLKAIIRCWVKDKRLHRSKNSIKNELSDIDTEVDRRVVSDTTLFRRLELQRKLHVINQMEAKDSFQKYKINLAIEEDENSKFFHGIINKKRSQLAIRGVFDNGLWFMLNFPFNKQLSDMQAADLERNVSRDEIRLAVWNCGENKSPGLDGYTFEFFREYWNIVGLDFYVLEAFEFGQTWCKWTHVDEGLFKGVHLKGLISISRLFYADDAMFIGEWSNANLKGIVNILQCFFLASGLKINIQKSQVLGVGIPRSIVIQAASSIGCGVMHNQFLYLGVTVGECLSRHQARDDTVPKLRLRLSNWKVKTLSIGGRLTLLKSVLGASPLYNMSIFKVPKGILKSMEAIRSNFFNETDSTVKKITWAAWYKILASKINGGLGVSSFHALNRALLLEWVWHFISQDGSLWFRVIQALYGPFIVSHPINLSSNWCSIVCELYLLTDKGCGGSFFQTSCAGWFRTSTNGRLEFASGIGISFAIS
nr:RNA-directed DNA polymerase, eukaryota [Tanacetum cinerariifolium]